jgi:uncharacterized membrane protein HdeD (DUF308 family)
LFQGAHRELSGATDIYGAKQGYIGFHDGVAGFVTFENPLLAAALLTLLLGFALVASGIMRIILAFSMKEGTPRICDLVQHNHARSRPRHPLGIDLILAGVGWISVGSGLKTRV